MSRRNWVSWLIAALPAVLGIFWIVLALLPYGILKPFLSALMPDGNFNSLKPENAAVFKLLLGLGGSVFLVVAVLTGLRRWKLFGPVIRQLWADTGRFFSGLSPVKDDIGFMVAVSVLMVLAVIYRLEYINASLHHDEAYTYVAFAHSLFSAISDYHLPNNHVFHSILVFLSTRLFGIQPWAVRLPAFTAGVLLVPVVYWLAKRLYDRWTGLASAALVTGWFQLLISYSTNARGYTLVALFTLLTLIFGSIALKQKNIFVWILISLFSALGFYTVPMMLFPFGILFIWLFLENLVEGPGPYKSKFDFLKYWMASGFSAAILAILFYTPILIFTGPAKVFGQKFLAPLSWADFWPALSSGLSQTWSDWTFRLPMLLLLLLVAGWILGLVFHWRISTTRIPLQLPAFLWILTLVIVQRTNSWSKVWIFLLPLMIMWAVAGIIGLLGKIRPKFVRGLPVAAVLLIGLIMLAETQHAVWLAPQLPGMWAEQGDEETALLFVQSQLRPDDLIIVAPPDDAPVWYYAELHGIKDSYFDTRIAFDRALVLVDPVEGQTPASVIAERGPDRDVLDIAACRELGTFGKMQVFGCPLK